MCSCVNVDYILSRQSVYCVTFKNDVFKIVSRIGKHYKLLNRKRNTASLLMVKTSSLDGLYRSSYEISKAQLDTHNSRRGCLGICSAWISSNKIIYNASLRL